MFINTVEKNVIVQDTRQYKAPVKYSLGEGQTREQNMIKSEMDGRYNRTRVARASMMSLVNQMGRISVKCTNSMPLRMFDEEESSEMMLTRQEMHR